MCTLPLPTCLNPLGYLLSQGILLITAIILLPLIALFMYMMLTIPL